jgi:predicted nucleic-acid-binding protein
MIALDTSVIVRIVTEDDPDQLKAAREVFKADSLWVCKTVLLETEWVLRYSYGLDPKSILNVFRKLLGYPQLQVEDRHTVLRAIMFCQLGLDFADALHLASSNSAARFVTFDQPFAKAASRLDEDPAVELLRS